MGRSKAKDAPRRGRPPKPGMVTVSMRMPDDLLDRLKTIAEDQTERQPVDRAPVLWTDIARDFLRKGCARVR